MVALAVKKPVVDKIVMKKKRLLPAGLEEASTPEDGSRNGVTSGESAGGVPEEVEMENGLVRGEVLDQKDSRPPGAPQSKNLKKMKARVVSGEAFEVASKGEAGDLLEKSKSKRRKKKQKVQGTGNLIEDAEASPEEGREDSAVLSPPEPVGMQIYWNLSSVDSAVREAASVALVRELNGAQRDYEDRGLGQEEKAAEAVILGEAKTETDGLKDCAPSVQYSLRRLIRGVASSRESARQGFALALTAVLGALPCVSGTDVVNMIKKHLDVSPSMKGQETRDALLGQLFGYGALIRCSRAIGTGITSEQQELVVEVAERLITLSKKKKFLREPAIYLIVQLGEQLEVSVLEKVICGSTMFLDVFKEDPNTISPDILFLALRLHQKLPISILQMCSLIPKSGKLAEIFEEEHLQLLVPCLMESSCSHPRVHSVWEPFLEILFAKSEPSRKSKKRRNSEDSTIEMRLKSFWTVVVDGALLSSSHERKNLAMQLLLLLLPRLPAPGYIKLILSKTFVQCLLGACASKDNLLYKSANSCIAQLCRWAEEDEDQRICAIVALQQCSQGKFDHLSRTHSVKGLMGGLTTITGYQATFQAFSSLYISAGNLEVDAIATAPWTPVNLKRKKAPDDMNAGDSVSITKENGQQRWAVDQLRSLCQQALAGLPANVVTQDLVAKFVPSLAPLHPLTDEEEESVATLQSTMLQVSTALSVAEAGDRKDRLQAMLSLLVQLLFESRLAPSIAVETASEITVCCKKAFGELVDLDIDFAEEDGDSPAFMDVLVDVLLSLLAQPSAPIRAAAEQVFRSFCGDLTSSGLTDLLRIIKKNTERSRHKPVVEVENQDEDEDILDIRDSDEESEDEQEESGSEENKDASDSDPDDDVVSAVVERVSLPNKRKKDESRSQESSDDEGEESETSDMDDETMFRMDKHLSNILKQRKQGGNGVDDSKDAQTQLIHFKFRVLALLEFFLQKHSGSILVLTMLPSLLHVFVNSCTTDGNMQVADRVSSILQNKLFKGKQYPKGPEVDKSDLKELLKKALKLASRSTVKRVALMAQAACHWILKVIQGNLDQEKDGDVEKLFSAALDDFFVHKKCRLSSTFFRECINRNPWLGNCLLGALLEKCVSARSKYLQFESLQLAGNILGFKSKKYSQKSNQLASDLSSQATFLKPYLSSLSKVIGHLWKEAPSAKAAHRIEALQFCISTIELHQRIYPDSLLKEFIDLNDLTTVLKVITPPPKSKLSSLVLRLYQIEEKSRMQ